MTKKQILIVVFFALTVNGCKSKQKTIACFDNMLILVIRHPDGTLPVQTQPGCRCIIRIDGKDYLTTQPQDTTLCKTDSSKIPQGFKPEFIL